MNAKQIVGLVLAAIALVIMLICNILDAQAEVPRLVTTASTSSTASVAPSLDVHSLEVRSSSPALCRDEWARIESLRADLDAIAALDPLSDHLPGILAGAVCMGIVTAVAQSNEWEAAQVTLLHGTCAGVGFAVDSIIDALR